MELMVTPRLINDDRIFGDGDEMFDRDGAVRAPYRGLHHAMQELGGEEIAHRSEIMARTYLDQGITFDLAGEERAFPVDAIPRVVEAEEWERVSEGVSQRISALEAFLTDMYTAREGLKDGVVPRGLVPIDSATMRVMDGYVPPNGVRIHIAGIDLIRGGDGRLRVLEDNVRIPSGVSYVLSNRRAMAHVFPELFPAAGVQRVSEYPSQLLSALRQASPVGELEATVVVLTPGRFNSAYFEHTLLARTMGVELVEASDLVVRERRLYMRTTAGLRRVDVVYRRIDDAFLDPLVFRPDSLLGVPGLIDAVLAGNVVLANAVGNGIADHKSTYRYVPDMIRYYLGEEPLLPQVDTWCLDDSTARGEVLDRLDEVVVKPVNGSGGTGVMIGPDATAAQREEVREKILADPAGWIAQPLQHLSTIPTLTEHGIRPRHADLRPFALNTGDGIWVLPGGLTRVALREGEKIVNSSRGGGSKDTWVLIADRVHSASEPPETHHAITGDAADGSRAALGCDDGLIEPPLTTAEPPPTIAGAPPTTAAIPIIGEDTLDVVGVAPSSMVATSIDAEQSDSLRGTSRGEGERHAE